MLAGVDFMEFKSKRKYTTFFIVALILHLAIVAFWLFFPKNTIFNEKGKQTATFLALVNCELILVFYLGLFRKKHFAYHNKLLIKRSFLKNIEINYKNIEKITEKANDSILLGFGVRPSFRIHYRVNERTKKYTIRSDNNQLLILIIKNEIDISKKTNN